MRLARATLRRASPSPRPRVAPLSTTPKKHETWRDDQGDGDNLPKVRRRDGTLDVIESVRGFVDYERNPEPYRAPMERVFEKSCGAGVGGRLATIRGSVDGACSEARVTLDADVAAAKTTRGDVSPKSLTGGAGSTVSSGDDALAA